MLFQETIHVSFKVLQNNEEIATFFPMKVNTKVDSNGHLLQMEIGRPGRKKSIFANIK